MDGKNRPQNKNHNLPRAAFYRARCAVVNMNGARTVIIIGIDPGVSGAVAMLHAETAKIYEILDLPVLADGPKGRKRINAPLLRSVFTVVGDNASVAYVEDVGPMPREGAVGAFSFGRTCGVIEGVLAGMQIPIRRILPREWKKRVKLPPGADKDRSRALALSLWPAHAAAFSRKKDDGRAEAALIAFAGSMTGGF